MAGLFIVCFLAPAHDMQARGLFAGAARLRNVPRAWGQPHDMFAGELWLDLPQVQDLCPAFQRKNSFHGCVWCEGSH